MTHSDLDILARTIWGEARGEHFEGKVAVGHVVLNRAKAQHRRETTIAGVATEPFQFSCWNPDDPNRNKLEEVSLNDRFFRASLKAALIAIEEQERGEDPTGGATHYHTTQVSPVWSAGKAPSAKIGSHLFYADID